MPVITCRLSEDEKEMLEVFCIEEDLTMSQVIRRAIKEYIEKAYKNED